MTDVHFWAILLAAIASMVIGSLWYGPLFGKLFMREMGMDQWSKEKREAEMKKMPQTYFAQFIASLVTFYVLALLIDGLFGGLSAANGVKAALIAWIGFVVPVKLGDALWGGKMSLFWLGIGNMLVTFLAAGAIIGAWN